MSQLSDIGVVSHVIQLAVTPAFLLTAIGSMLTVMTNRLARVIDRARRLEDVLENAPHEGIAALHADLRTLARRSKLISRAITLCTSAAIMICTVIAILFLGNFFQFSIAIPIAMLFVLAMLLLVIGMIILLREIFIGTTSLRIGPHDTGGYTHSPKNWKW